MPFSFFSFLTVAMGMMCMMMSMVNRAEVWATVDLRKMR
jgi:hypothetical protein